MKDWKIVYGDNYSKTKIGYPMGELLCRNEECVKEAIKKLTGAGVKNVKVKNYIESKPDSATPTQ